jgi:hypothetical protein
MQSPFSQILEPYAGQLPAPLYEQYLCSADSSQEIVLGGKMRRIWHRPRWLWPAFWLLAQGDILFPETGENVPTILVIRPGRDQEGHPVQTWERTFHFSRQKRRRYTSTMIADASAKRVVELQGPKNTFEEVAEITFSPPDRLEFLTVQSTVQLGPLRLRLPHKLWITAHVVQRVLDSTSGTSHVSLTVTHGLFGPVFGYDGEFRAACRMRRDRDNVIKDLAEGSFFKKRG